MPQNPRGVPGLMTVQQSQKLDRESHARLRVWFVCVVTACGVCLFPYVCLRASLCDWCMWYVRACTQVCAVSVCISGACGTCVRACRRVRCLRASLCVPCVCGTCVHACRCVRCTCASTCTCLWCVACVCECARAPAGLLVPGPGVRDDLGLDAEVPRRCPLHCPPGSRGLATPMVFRGPMLPGRSPK